MHKIISFCVFFLLSSGLRAVVPMVNQVDTRNGVTRTEDVYTIALQAEGLPYAVIFTKPDEKYAIYELHDTPKHNVPGHLEHYGDPVQLYADLDHKYRQLSTPQNVGY